MNCHQYINRHTGRVFTEDLIADNWVRWLYGEAREKAPFFFKAVTSARITQWLAYLNFDMPLQSRPTKIRQMIDRLGIDLDECVASVHELDSARKLFERKIEYWHWRPMPGAPGRIVSPADAKALVGSTDKSASFFIKEKFFSFEEMLGTWQENWLDTFTGGNYAIFRLTPEKYHYNHLPVSGRVVDLYAIEGECHSCNPAAVVAEVTPYSKNKRVVTIIDTDVPDGTQAGLVAMVEVVALMIGEVVQSYSSIRYDDPQTISIGMFVKKGQPKSLFRPGSSVDVLFFQKDRMRFDKDLVANSCRTDVHSRFSRGFRQPLVETDVRVRSSIGMALAI